MQIVPRPRFAPHKCAVTLRSEDPDGFIQTGITLTEFDPSIEISMTGARELAKVAGWVDPAVHAAVEEELAAVRAQLDQAVEEISEQRKFREQVDGLAAAGMNVVKTGGRPSTKTRPEVIRDELKAAA